MSTQFKKRMAIIGSGDLGCQACYHAEASGQYVVTGFFDDTKAENTRVQGRPVLGPVASVKRLFQESVFDELFIGVGYRHMAIRKILFERFVGFIPFGTIVGTGAIIDPEATIGSGVIIYPGCIVDLRANIGDNVLLNLGSIVSHDSQIGAHSFVSPGVNVAGFVRIGERCNLGIGTIIIDNLHLCADIQTGAGAVVTKSLSRPGLYIGVPARLTPVRP